MQLNKKHITLMFNTGARIPGRFPHLEGDGPNARFMRFADLADIEVRADELRRIVAAWCELKSSAGGEAKAAEGTPSRRTTSAKRSPARTTAPRKR